MARKGYRKYGRKSGAGKGGAFRNGRYNFTTRRKYALQRAADISARKRKKTNHGATAKKVAVLAGVAGVAYLGYRNRTTIGRNAGNWAAAVNPWNKERTRVNNAISVGMPSQTTVIGPTQRAAAQATRDAMAQAALPPHMGGPDNRIYDENNNIDTDAMTAGSVSRTVRAGRRRTQGTKTGSLTGTPGGRRRPAKANPANKPKESEYLDYVWENDILVPVSRTRRGVPATTAGSVNTTASVTAAARPGRTRQGAPARTADPMRSLEGMRAADERLLSGKDQPTDSGVAPVEFLAPVLDKPAPRAKAASKPKAPTTGKNTTKDAKPAKKAPTTTKLVGDHFELGTEIPNWDKMTKDQQKEVTDKVRKKNRDWYVWEGRVEELPF